MTTERDVVALFTEANPMPSQGMPTELAELPFEAADPRFDDDHGLWRRGTPTIPARAALVAAVATAVVAAGAFVLLQLADDEASVVADDTSAVVDTATGFLDAVADYDADRAAAYLSPRALADTYGSLEDLRRDLRFSDAQRYRLLLDACDELGATEDGTAVRCAYDYQALGSDRMWLGPYTGSWYDLTVDAGRVTSIEDHRVTRENGFMDEMWRPFAEWVSTNHIVDAVAMYSDGTRVLARVTDESILLWQTHIDEYARDNRTATGFAGLPPVSATPSDPAEGTLVASMWDHIGAPGTFGNGWLYLYADGRLIWEQLDPNPTGGWLERRLTPEGVELIRSEIIATGLFDPDQPPPRSSGTGVGSIQVRNGDRLVAIDHVVPDLFDRLADLWSWMPADAWADRGVKAYVASRYAVCVHSGGFTTPIDPMDQLIGFPAAARDALAGARQLQMGELVDIDPAGFHWAEGSTEYCFDVATDEARTLATVLDDAGVEQLPHRAYDGSEVTYVIARDDDNDIGLGFNGVTLTLWPMLPHGVPAITGA